ncbi:putative retrotransposon hot spot (RHS) protein [Trypanosoma cruzi]|uniref:Putative retrotransposon hot spot (RHS) protein n=1 Tax=Trypanosoma cruzi TaxID=5693 RepID=A0A2V2VT72_TRYCR|nr:putative retrotransposon hot spot (RHS) protein [Trypanosoma cruzi]
MWALDSRVEECALRKGHDSAYDARWHHVMEVPDGEGTGMDVRGTTAVMDVQGGWPNP